jgi:TonB family protein
LLCVAFAQTEPPSGVTTPAASPPAAAVPESVASVDERLVVGSDPKEVVAANERLVKSREQEFGKNSRQSAEAYADLADSQRRAGQHEAAEKSYLTVVEIYRAIDGPFSTLVIQPLTSLGDNYQESGDYLNAVSVYSEARTVNRRAFGLLNEDQIPLLDKLTKSFIEMNKPVEADQQQLEALRIIERGSAPESEAALAALYKYAGWLRESYRYQEERDQYMRAMRTIATAYGKEDVRRVQPLIGIGNSYRLQRIPDMQGAGSLREALALLVAQKERNELAIAEVLRDLGDWEVAFAKADYDGTEYRRAWELLGNVPNGAQLRADWFTGATYVLREPMSLRGVSQAPNALAGHVLVKFDLDRAGRSDDVTIVEADPAGLKDDAVLRHIRRSRFRPQIENGELVPRDGLTLLFTFHYLPDALTNENGEPRKD